ncbi:MAG: carboxypeptidase-like regulatory domain-containing protein [Saprospiraceae bacterium]|nr:carboxypeptidase-like regulatory domain-containing protein [Saprospiraceae bacterium]
MYHKFIAILLFTVFSQHLVVGQHKNDLIKVVQFSGMVFYEDDNGQPAPLPYTNVAVMGTSRGAAADMDGFFSFVALAGETVVFSRIGFKTVEIKIPDTLVSDQYKWIQIMTEDNILLPEAIIMPWPSKEHFKQEFLAIDISDELRENAEVNLAEEKMKEIRHSVPVDGRETTSIVIKQQATDYVYTGQTKPQNIFNPLAWKKFIDAWRRGDFKKKDKTK